MNRQHSTAHRINSALIKQVTGYYNDTREMLAFSQRIENAELEEICRLYLKHWKGRLKSYIFENYERRV